MNEIKNVKKLIDILHKNCKLSLEQIATMADMTVPEAAAAIDALEADGIIIGYGAIINWNKIPEYEKISAYIEMKVTPQRNQGYNRLAERIYQFPQVKSLNLMSGSYDFGVTVVGESIQEIALFVSEYLAPMESVLSTATHFVLKRFKSDGIVYDTQTDDNREACLYDI